MKGYIRRILEERLRTLGPAAKLIAQGGDAQRARHYAMSSASACFALHPYLRESTE